jgi:hypothetical protein
MAIQLIEQGGRYSAPRLEFTNRTLEQAGGHDFGRRRATRRSMIRATDMMEATISGQMGQPAA